MGEKWCAKCATTRPLSEFWRNRDTADGHQAYCVACHRARHRYDLVAEAQHLPAEPLLAAAARLADLVGTTVTEVFEPYGEAALRAYQRARSSGRITRRKADELAVTIFHVHPVALWPDEWFIEPERMAS